MWARPQCDIAEPRNIDQLMDLIRQINTREHLYLERLIELEDLEVEFWIREAESSRGARPSDGPASSVFDIASRNDCQLYRVLFEGYIAFAVFNESYENLPKEKTFSSRLFQVLSKSTFLDYVVANADINYARVFSEAEPRHYRVNCLNHVIDVATCFEPSIEVVQRNGFA